MSRTLDRVRELVARHAVQISDHGYDELTEDGLFVEDIVAGLTGARVVEDYPTYHRGPCVLVLQRDREHQPIHVVWGIPKDAASPAVVVTAYRPDPARWSQDFMRRAT